MEMCGKAGATIEILGYLQDFMYTFDHFHCALAIAGITH
jgi:hypothetical protein